MKLFLLLLISFFFIPGIPLRAQGAKAEPRGFVLPFEIGQGFTSSSSSPPELYLASVYIKPCYSFAKNNVRVGATGMLAYNNGVVTYFAGPQLFIKIFQLNASSFGSLLKIYLTGDALWGTRNKKLYGGGIGFEIEPVVLSVNARQEYTNKQLWFDASLGFNIDRFFRSAKKDDDPFK